MRFRCKKCGTMVVRKEVASACLDWCDAARKIIGENKTGDKGK
jgi:hypothetical protein